jgi:hypothetical protein
MGFDTVTFDAARSLKVPGAHALKLVVMLADAPVEADMRVQLSEQAQIGPGTWRYAGKWTDLPAPVRSALESVQERRQARRVKEEIQVMCKAIPGYRAISVDLSPTGVGIISHGPVATGQVVELLLDLDDQAGHAEVGAQKGPARATVQARVVHCSPFDDSRWRVGFAIESLSKSSAVALMAYLKKL